MCSVFILAAGDGAGLLRLDAIVVHVLGLAELVRVFGDIVSARVFRLLEIPRGRIFCRGAALAAD